MAEGYPDRIISEEEIQELKELLLSQDLGYPDYTMIKSLSSGEPNDAWEKYSRQSAFKEDEYKTYTEGKSTVTAYSFEEVTEMPECIDLEKIREVLGSFDHQAGQRITVSDWEKIRGIMQVFLVKHKSKQR